MMAWQGIHPPFNASGSEVQLLNGIYQLTLQPNSDVATISEKTLISIAKACQEINAKGVPIMLRYGTLRPKAG